MNVEIIKNILENNNYNVSFIEKAFYGHNNVFKFLSSDQTYYVKCADTIYKRKKFLNEEKFYSYIKENKISFPVPNLFKLICEEKYTLVITSELKGRALIDVDNCESVQKQIVESIHNLQKCRINTIKAQDIVNRNLIEIENSIEVLKSNGLLIEPSLLPNIKKLSNTLIDSIHLSMIHGDIGFTNIIVDKDKISGFIDYEWSRIDDSIAELPPLLLWLKGNNVNVSKIIDLYKKDLEISSFNERLMFGLLHRSLVRTANMFRMGKSDSYVVSSTLELIKEFLNSGDPIDYLNKGRQIGRVLYFNINYFCNNDCVFCFSHHTSLSNKNSAMDFITFQAILNQVKVDKRDKIVINGGEPSLNEDFYKIVALSLKTNAYQVDVYSNGRLINIDNLNQMKNKNKLHFIIPIHGSESNHDSITQIQGSFLEALRTLQNLTSINYSIKFILNDGLIKDNFDIKDFIKNNNLRPSRIIIARQNYTIKARQNKCIQPSKIDEKYYLSKIFESLKDQPYIICYLDYPFCYLPDREIVQKSGEYDFYFSDYKHQLEKKIYRHELNMDANCTKCSYYEKCQLLSKTYNLLKQENDKLIIELE